MPEHVFVVGSDEHNQHILDGMPDAGQYEFHDLLTFEEIYTERIEFSSLLATARQRLDAFDEPIAAIVGFWDFPVSSMLPILRAHVGLPGARLEEVITCEHKYWSRLVQQQVITEIPRFGLIDLDDSSDRPPEGLSYPMWVKPVKSFSSVLAFGVSDDAELAAALAELRQGIGRVGEAFDELLEHMDLPPEIEAAGGQVCLAEEAITGQMVTLEGFRFGERIHIYGVVDSVRYDDSPSFLRFQYPSSLPTEVSLRMAEIAEKLVLAIGLDRMTFNIEFFWDPATDRITLLEINPRHSQSHAELFEDVDGIANHDTMLQLALGNDPALPIRQGRWAYAAKWFLRRFSDGVVRKVPSKEDIEWVQHEIPGVTVELAVEEGDRLSELLRQDSYSYAIANVYIGAEDEAELTAKFDRVAMLLRFEIVS